MLQKSLKVSLALVAAFAIASCGGGGGGGAAIGSPCTTHEDCQGVCFDPGGGSDPYCTDSCDRTADEPCPSGYECTELDIIGYVCVQQPGNPLGDPCTDGADCSSGFCNHDVCSRCEDDGDCPGGGTCVLDQTLDYYVCEGGTLGDLGDPCTDGADCTLDFCYDPPGAPTPVCSRCEVDGDCTGEQVCTYDAGDGYASCTGGGLGDLGDACTDGAQCTSTFCNTLVCSECEGDGDCTGGGTCEDDLAGVGYFVCEGGGLGDLGDTCTVGTECTSGHCYNPPGPGADICSECEVDDDCTGEQVCTYNAMAGDTYAHCRGTAALGDACASGAECASGFCNTLVCSECEGDGDCTGGGTCEDDLAGVGYFVCSGGMGDDCTDGAECTSTFCYNPPGPGANICSECEEDGDCTGEQACTYNFGVDTYAHCRGTAALGDACTAGVDCASGFCNTLVCSECEGDGDCGEGGTCVNDTTAGYFVCSGGLGDQCTDGTDCTSTFCFVTPGPDFCSECAVNDDCTGGDTCDWSWPDGYAVCG